MEAFSSHTPSCQPRSPYPAGQVGLWLHPRQMLTYASGRQCLVPQALFTLIALVSGCAHNQHAICMLMHPCMCVHANSIVTRAVRCVGVVAM